MVNQVHATIGSDLADLRADSDASACQSGPTFDGSREISADADLIVVGYVASQ